MVRPHRRTVPALIAALLLSLFTIIPTSANNATQGLPFAQNWSNEGQITISDNWSGVLGIEGYLGQDITAATGVDPQTLLGVSSATNDLDIIANQTNTAITNGGVAEFQTVGPEPVSLTDATVALQGSGTADAPYLLLHLDTTGAANVTVSYNLRDIDGTTDNSIQPVALQFRVGSSGDFTNIPAGFVPDASEGPSLATLVTPVSALLPAAANNQPLIQVRIMTTNAVGNDEWVGVDDINVTGEPFVEPTPTPTPEASPTPTPTPTPTPVATPAPITISQVYGGGGNIGAPLTHDFVELFNRSGVAQSLAGMSVQYASATGSGNLGANSGQLTELPEVTLEPGEYYLIQEAGGTNGAPLPQPDLVDGTPIAMAAGAGKVALVTGQTTLGCNGGSTPCAEAQLARIVDLVGYGNANFFEGTAAAPTLSSTLAAFRDDAGATDTNDNAADFTAAAPSPHLAEDADPFVASSFPSNGAANVAAFTTLTVTFSEPVVVSGSWYDLTCGTSGTHLATVAGGPTSYTINPTGTFAGGESCALTVFGANVTDVDASDPPDGMDGDAVIAFAVAADVVCGASDTPIGQIQGTGPSSPMQGSVVEIEGVVVGAYPGTTGFRGFFVQEEDADQDGNPQTSDGIFVFEANGGATYAAGDLVRVRGRVTEFTSSGQTLTELDNLTNVATCGADHSVTPTAIEIPFASATFAERYEGMLVEGPAEQDLVVTELFNFGRFGEIMLTTDERQWTPTHLVEPGDAATAMQVANNLDRIVLDDGRNDQNIDPTVFPAGGLSASNTIRVGDTLAGGSFVLEQRFGAYRLQPTSDRPDFVATNPRPSTPPDVGGELRVAAMNVLNYFTTFDTIRGSNNGPNICGPLVNLECRGANTDFEFQRQRTKIIQAILGLDASVVGLMEIENNVSASTQDLVDGLNAETAPGTWGFVDTGPIGTDAIKVALIYRPGDVTPAGDFAILDATVDPRFNDARNRPALAQTFDADGGRFTVVVNHLKSKGSDCGGAPDDDLTLGGAGNCNGTRTLAAEALVDWIAEDPTLSGDRDVLVIGDLNSYAQEAPIDVFRDAGYTDTLAASLGSDAYSFVFQGMSGYLDHGLASPTLTAQVTGAAEWHINADEPPVLDYNDDFKSANHVNTLYAPTPYRSSDHDPLIVGLDLLDYGFEGYRPPVNPDNTATINAGAALPMKFTLDNATGLDVLFANPRSQEVTCATGAPEGGWEPTAATDGLTEFPAGTYTYDWKTDKGWADTCRVFELTLDDGSYWTARIHFIK
jgi:predicted extracellular nuclease